MPITVDADVALNYLDIASLDSNANARIISLKTLLTNWTAIHSALANNQIILVEKTDEYAATIWHVITDPEYAPWVQSRRLRFITGGDADVSVANLNSEHFLAATIGSQSTLPTAMQITERTHRPYTFLFTNRKVRPHRRYLILQLKELGLLDDALWSCLHQYNTWGHQDFNRVYAEGTSMPVKTLNTGYDPEERPDWIDGIIYPRQYQDTWFTLVSETGFEYPHSFRTEKIYKPILAGHPFIVCANAGFYRDLQNLGFRTFGSLINERFDSIIDGQGRLDALINEIKWLCSQDLEQFWRETLNIRLYNQHRALELHNSQRSTFNQQLEEFINVTTV